MYYSMTIAGLKRDLPICPVNENLSIAGFVIFGDQELTVACARELLKKAPEYDYIITEEAKDAILNNILVEEKSAAADADLVIGCVAQRLPDGCGGTAERQSVRAGPHGEWSHQQYASNDGFHAVGLYRHPDGCQRCTE